MIQVTPESLHKIVRCANVRRRPEDPKKEEARQTKKEARRKKKEEEAKCRRQEGAKQKKNRIGRRAAPKKVPSAGCRSWFQYDELSCDGRGCLTSRTTDLQHTVICKMPVDGECEPWRVVLDAWRLDCLRYLEGGSLEVELVPAHRRLLLQKGNLHLRLPTQEMGAPFPEPDTGSQSARALANPHALVEALCFVSGGDLEKPGDRAQFITLFGDGVAMGHCEGVWLTKRGPALGFDLNLTKDTGRRIAHWLHVVQDDQNEVIEIVQVGDAQSGIHYQFQTTDGQYVLIVRAAGRAFGRVFIEGKQHKPLAWAARVDRRLLANRCSFFGETAEYRRVVWTLQRDENGQMALHIRQRSDGQSAQDVIPINEYHALGSPTREQVEVNGETAAFALRQYSSADAWLLCPATSRSLCVRAATTPTYDDASAEAFIDIAGPRQAPLPDQEHERSLSQAVAMA